MKQRTANTLSWSLLAATLLLSAGSFVLVWLNRSAPVPDVIGFRGFDALLAVAFASVGAVIVARRPSHPVGWLLFAFGASNALISLAQQYAFFAIVGRADPLLGGAVAAWTQEWFSVSLGALFVLLLLLFPTGRLPSRRWHPVAVLAVAGSLLETIGSAFMAGPITTFRALDNPFAVTGTLGRVVEIGDAFGNMLFLTTVVAAAASVIVRFRRAERIERQQLKWIAAAAVLVGVGLVAFVLTGQEAGSSVYARPVQIFFILAIISVPVAAAIAILRYRLYEIDRVISRTVSYAIVTIILGGTFALVTLGPVLVVGRGGSAPDYVIAAATLVVFALFRPVRRRVQAFVDRRFDRSRYDAARLMESFSARVRREVDLDALGTELRELVAGTMRPSHVSLWVRPPAERQR